jgi:lysophospholipase L1-like esterase
VIGNLVEILGEHLHISVNNKPNMYYNNEVITLKTWSKRNTLPTNDSKLYFSDGMHPSELTYKVWGKETGLFIKSKIRK